MLNKKVPFVLVNTLLLHIPLLALTDGQNDRQTETKYTCCAWAGGTFFQLCCCVSFLFWREIGFGFTYLRTLLKKIILQTNIFLIVVEVLRFLVRQCVVSFHSHFQYGLLPPLTPHSSDPRSKNQHCSGCKQQHCYCPCHVDLLSLLLAAVTIVVKKRLVNSITYFSSLLLLLE
jgi:hypothetical protein